jgi:hypothetical protein
MSVEKVFRIPLGYDLLRLTEQEAHTLYAALQKALFDPAKSGEKYLNCPVNRLGGKSHARSPSFDRGIIPESVEGFGYITVDK